MDNPKSAPNELFAPITKLVQAITPELVVESGDLEKLCIRILSRPEVALPHEDALLEVARKLNSLLDIICLQNMEIKSSDSSPIGLVKSLDAEAKLFFQIFIEEFLQIKTVLDHLGINNHTKLLLGKPTPNFNFALLEPMRNWKPRPL